MNEGPAWLAEVFGGWGGVDVQTGWEQSGSPTRVFRMKFTGSGRFGWGSREEFEDVWSARDSAKHGVRVRYWTAMGGSTHLYVIGAESQSRSLAVGDQPRWF